MKVLFVCSGNICRSAMAAAYFRRIAADKGLSHVLVDSAGTLGIEGSPASREAIEALREVGVDLSDHRSRGVRAEDLRTADLVVAMTRDHLEFLAARHPHGDGERVLIRFFENGPDPDPDAPDLVDPMGQPLAFYRAQLPVLMRCLDHLALNVKHRV
jgi:protein-tyrosine-phosphatase